MHKEGSWLLHNNTLLFVNFWPKSSQQSIYLYEWYRLWGLYTWMRSNNVNTSYVIVCMGHLGFAAILDLKQSLHSACSCKRCYCISSKTTEKEKQWKFWRWSNSAFAYCSRIDLLLVPSVRIFHSCVCVGPRSEY